MSTITAPTTAADSHSEVLDDRGEWVHSGDGSGPAPVPTTAEDALREAAQAWSGYLSHWHMEEQASADEHGTPVSGEYRIVWTDDLDETIATLEVHAPTEDIAELWIALELEGRTVYSGYVAKDELLAHAHA